MVDSRGECYKKYFQNYTDGVGNDIYLASLIYSIYQKEHLVSTNDDLTVTAEKLRKSSSGR